MTSIQQLKAQLTLTTVAEKFNIPLTKGDGRQPCPFCSSHTAFKTTRNEHYVCFKCGKRGDILNLLVDYEICKTNQEAFRELAQLAAPGEHIYREKATGLADVHEYFLEQARKNPNILKDFATSRGYSLAVLKDVGYAPPGNDVPDHIRALLVRYNLWYEAKPSRPFFQDRLIFPVRDCNGSIVHFTSRAVDPTVEPRWMHSQHKPPINNYLYNLDQIPKDKDYVVVTEGVTDCLSLLEIGEPAVACFGVHNPMVHYAWALKHITHLVAIFDRDKYALGTEKFGQYKSWSNIMPGLINLSLELQIPIFCCMVPDWSGVKDVNDYLITIEYDPKEYRRHLANNCIPLEKFAFDLYKNDIKQHDQLWRLAKYNLELELMLKQFVDAAYPSWTSYLKTLL
jgi:hypothetical protein